MLAGLAFYGIGAFAALFSANFEMLLTARIVSAVGAAVGSIGTQTILRDRFQGQQLAQIFSSVGIAVALSPAIGMAIGAVAVGLASYAGVFATLAALALLLFAWTSASLPETQPTSVKPVSFWDTAIMMIKEGRIWCSAFLVALFNLSLFGYDQLSPFQLEQLSHGSGEMGASGVLLSLGTLLGAMANRKLLQKGWEPERLVFVSCVLATAGGLLVALLGSSFMFIVPVAMVAFAFALAIPNILAPALKDYSDRLRTAGAIFGMKYYLLLGAGLWLSGLAQNLGAVLLASGLGALTITMLKPKSRAARQTGDTATRKPVRLYRELFR